MTPEQLIWIDYTNWRNERSWRPIIPKRIFFGKTMHHPEPQWMLEALCLTKNAKRDFALADIHAFKRQEEDITQ